MPQLESATPSIRADDLSFSQRQLLDLMQQLQYGQINGLKFFAGEPDPESVIELVHAVKFEDGQRKAKFEPTGGSLLKQKAVRLFEYLQVLRDGEIDSLEVQAGLPFRMKVHHHVRLGDDTNWIFLGGASQKARTARTELGY